jgi:hypothetical protein
METWITEWSKLPAQMGAACATNGSNMLAIAVPQHLHALTSFFGHKDVPRPVEGDARGGLELAVA